MSSPQASHGAEHHLIVPAIVKPAPAELLVRTESANSSASTSNGEAQSKALVPSSHSGTSRMVYLWATVASLAGMLFGYDTAVISGAEQSVQEEWGASEILHGLAISSALWGTVIGALFGGVPSDRLGRKTTLILIGVLYAASALGSALAWDLWSFTFFRFIGGLGVGASTIAAPAYIAEMAPKSQRGVLVALYQLSIVVGILFAYASNFAIHKWGGFGTSEWRWMLGVETAPAVLYLGATLVIPESPRWLAVVRGDTEKARELLKRISPDDYEAVVADMETEASESRTDEFHSRSFKHGLWLVFLLAAFNQLSGINMIIYYAKRVFELADMGDAAALLANVGVGVVNVIFTVLGLVLIDRIGRRSLMIIGSVGYIVSLAAVGYGFVAEHYSVVPWFIFAFIASHAIGQGCVIWVYISEVFSNSTRATGQAVGCGTHWMFAALITMVMPQVFEAVAPGYVFFFFSGMMVLQLVFTLTMMVETKGRSLEEISKDLAPKSASHEEMC